MYEESTLVMAHRPFIAVSQTKEGMVVGAPEPLGIHTLLLHHGEIAVPRECAHQKGAHLALKKTTTTAKSAVCQEEEKKNGSVARCQLRILSVSLGICGKTGHHPSRNAPKNQTAGGCRPL